MSLPDDSPEASLQPGRESDCEPNAEPLTPALSPEYRGEGANKAGVLPPEYRGEGANQGGALPGAPGYRDEGTNQSGSLPGTSEYRGEGANKTAGRLYVLAAALLWSSGGFFAKAPLFPPEVWPGPVLAFWRAFFASLLLVPLVRRPKWNWKLVPMALMFAAMNYTYLSCMALSEASNAIWLQSTSPVWVLLISAFLLGERPHGLDWLLVACGATGAGLILYFELQGKAPQAMAYGLLSGAFYAGVVLSLRVLRDQDAMWLVAVNHVATALLLSPAAVTMGKWPEGWQWLYLAGFGIVQMGLPYFLFARGLKLIPGHEASGIGLLEPVLVPVWVYAAWHASPDYSPPRWWTLVGGGLILVGLAARYLAARRH